MSRHRRRSPERTDGGVASPPQAADFLAVHRGGGLLTEAVDQRIGAHLSAAAWRLGLSPTALTLLDLAIGLATSISVVVVAGPVRRGTVPAWAVGVAALVLWHLAYSLDCADGQLARVTGRTSPSGARLDILVDVAVHVSVVAALAATAGAQDSAPSPWLVAVVAGTWMVNVVTSVLQSGELAASVLPSGSRRVRFLKLVRDHSFVLTVCAVAIGFFPTLTLFVMIFFACVNGVYLAASIATAALQSARPPMDRSDNSG